MRPGVLFALGTVLYLETFGAFASVICDSKHDSTTNGTATPEQSPIQLIDLTEDCVASISTSGSNEHQIKKKSGAVALTVTYFGTPLSNAQHCVDQLRSIIDQCFTRQGVNGGISHTTEALYDIHEHKRSEDLEERAGTSTIQARSVDDRLSDERDVPELIGHDNTDEETSNDDKSSSKTR
jgi:hypothetical protein